MDEKKYFGIGAVVLMILVALAPAVNSMQLNLGKESNNILNSNDEVDIQVTLNKCQFLKYEFDGNGEIKNAVYEVEYAVSHKGAFSEEKIINCKLKTEGYSKIFDSWKVRFKKNIYKETIEGTRTIKLTLNDERKFGANIVRLETDYGDDADNSNNVGRVFAQYWRDDPDYEPSLVHMDLTLPHNGWVTGANIYTFETNGEVVELEVPTFGNVYRGFAWPIPFNSKKLGWIGEFTKHMLLFTAELCYFLSRITTILKDTYILAAEVITLIGEIIVIANTTKNGEEITQEQVVLFLSTFSLLFISLGNFFNHLTSFWDPVVVGALAATTYSFWYFLASTPWNNPIGISGFVRGCKIGEEVVVSCRDVQNLSIPGKKDREIEQFYVNSTWKKGDSLFFRNCQVTVTGDKHPGCIARTPKAFSFVAPNGSLCCAFGLDKTRDTHKQPYLLNFFSNFPLLMKLLPTKKIKLTPILG